MLAEAAPSRIGVVIPAYQAERTLPSVIARLPASIAPRLAAIWVVNDGSTDSTAEVVRELARADARLRLIDLPRNGGYGIAVREGLRAARAAGVDAAACVHADGQYAPELLPELLSTLERRGLDLLQGSRIASGTALSGGMPLHRYLGNRALTTLENLVLGAKLTDYHSGYLIYGPRALRLIPFDRLSPSFDFDLEVIVCALTRGLSVGEHPIPTRYADEVSHLRCVSYGLRVLGVLAGYLEGRYHPQPEV